MKKIRLVCFVLLFSGSAATFAECFSYIPETAPDSAFSDHGNGLITDVRTGLMWRKCTEGQSGESCVGVESTSQYTWQEALQYVADVNKSDTYSDWRLPNKKELESIMANNCVAPSINETYFSLFSYSNSYWTSTTYAGSTDSAWTASFWYGKVEPRYKTGKQFIRLVRGG